MFQTGHLHELKPETWREDLLGEGASGTVYRAEWRGVAVAVGHAMHTPRPPGLSCFRGTLIGIRIAKIA
jgi:predicted Ser/Thr protein kinase